VGDVSFISLTKILPHLKTLASEKTIFCIMMKPQFEAMRGQTTRGIVKNDKQRREIIKQFEIWLKDHGFFILNSADNEITGEKGNKERFYLLNCKNYFTF
jgi:23S rRNA (cytidine1920-2'-O)/16S rRNA (cytidine1409-2'-O)-methyltransferase